MAEEGGFKRFPESNGRKRQLHVAAGRGGSEGREAGERKNSFSSSWGDLGSPLEGDGPDNAGNGEDTCQASVINLRTLKR